MGAGISRREHSSSNDAALASGSEGRASDWSSKRGALGLAHVGVLQWLEENRIPVDVIAGASMGSLVGGILRKRRVS